jgi:predicted dienelactone hydrolase
MDRHPAPLLALLVLAAACTVVPPAPPPGSPNARLLAEGPFDVEHRDYALVDRSRPNDARTDDARRSPRRLTTTVWFPRGVAGPHPLVMYSHGFLSTRRGGAYLAEWLASRGYVVAAPDHPLTAHWAWGGRVIEDVVNQPADLSFVIDTILGWDDEERPFDGTIARERIGVMGLSLGGMTATLAAYHPRLRDPRIRAAVSIAGPMTIFGPEFFAAVPVPFVMIAGDQDVVIDYASNAPLVSERVAGGQLVTIAGGSHAGFDDLASGALRVLPNPDVLACWWLSLTLDLSDSRETLAALAGEESGDLIPASVARPCANAPPWSAIDPARQQLITKIAVGAFLDSQLAPDPTVRGVAAAYLLHDLARDFPEVRYEAAPPTGTPQ